MRRSDEGRCVFFFVSHPAAALVRRRNVRVSAPLCLTRSACLVFGFYSLIHYYQDTSLLCRDAYVLLSDVFQRQSFLPKTKHERMKSLHSPSLETKKSRRLCIMVWFYPTLQPDEDCVTHSERSPSFFHREKSSFQDTVLPSCHNPCRQL